MSTFNVHTCSYYLQALRFGVKYIYRTMPRMLTLWLDLAESNNPKKCVVEVGLDSSF